MPNLALAFALTLFAGLATGIGGLVAFFVKGTNYRFLSVSTGFSAGVCSTSRLWKIFFKGEEALVLAYGPTMGKWINVAAFFGGILLTAVIDALIPEPENPHQPPSASVAAHSGLPSGSSALKAELKGKLMRMGLFTALAIALHNFPEGLATFLATLQEPALGMAIAVAVALHNIPEGISVAVPIYFATGSRRKALLYSFLSGLAEPVGAAIAFLGLLLAFGGGEGAFPSQVMGILFSGVAGIMVYISLDELLPTSRAYGRGHDSLIGLLSGMAVMALSLLLL